MLKLCDLHTDALGSSIDKSMAKRIPKGHPLDILSKENEALQKQVDKIKIMMCNLVIKMEQKAKATKR